jgi:hypothetical protein
VTPGSLPSGRDRLQKPGDRRRPKDRRMSARNEEPLPEDATLVGDQEALLEAERGVILHELTVQFEASAEEAHWSRLIQELRFEDRTVGDERMAGFVSLSARPEPFTPYLIGEVRSSAAQPSLASWTFQWARAPQEPPSEDMLTLSNTVGTFPTILDKLGVRWPASAPLEAEVSATYVIGSTRRLRLPSARGRKLQAGEREIRVTPTRWRLEPPSGPVQEVLSHQLNADLLLLTGQGTYTLRWTPRFLNEVDGAIWGGLKNFLEFS